MSSTPSPLKSVTLTYSPAPLSIGVPRLVLVMVSTEPEVSDEVTAR